MDIGIESKIKYYEDKIIAGEFNLEMRFTNSISQMPMHKLRTEFSSNIEDYEVLYLNVNKVVQQLEHDGEKRFPQNTLFLDHFTVSLIEFIESGEKIIPPEIVYIKNVYWKVLDGQHRISLMRYLKLENAPFLIRKSDLNNAEELK
ncbi:hypothetical protein [Daejeonella sp. JGW-45]|uniref:hypothetical protein n=1 Tax=Daejeonella sp. JGW-45 TaxID=3034148 RepID=UPI0023EDB78C|nr:hypothetical protein [Daejeonella sp. JGW-45]